MLTIFAIAAVCGLLIGTIISRQSLEEKAVQGGMPAKVVHYLACSALSSTTPTVILSIITGLAFVNMFQIALSFFISGAILVVIYGFIESQAPVPTEELKPQLD